MRSCWVSVYRSSTTCCEPASHACAWYCPATTSAISRHDRRSRRARSWASSRSWAISTSAPSATSRTRSRRIGRQTPRSATCCFGCTRWRTAISAASTRWSPSCGAIGIAAATSTSCTYKDQVRELMESTGFRDYVGEDHFLDPDEAIPFLFHRVLDPAICIYECPMRVFQYCQNLPKRVGPGLSTSLRWLPVDRGTDAIAARTLGGLPQHASAPGSRRSRATRVSTCAYTRRRAHLPFLDLLEDPAQIPQRCQWCSSAREAGGARGLQRRSSPWATQT